MDGKVIRNTIAPGGAPDTEIKLFSALCHDEAIVIAQLRIPEPTNEITQVPALPAEVDLTGMVVTGYAAHARTPLPRTSRATVAPTTSWRSRRTCLACWIGSAPRCRRRTGYRAP